MIKNFSKEKKDETYQLYLNCFCDCKNLLKISILSQLYHWLQRFNKNMKMIKLWNLFLHSININIAETKFSLNFKVQFQKIYALTKLLLYTGKFMEIFWNYILKIKKGEKNPKKSENFCHSKNFHF